jgi:3-oxoacyl-[acyl-carrier protein] reductase
MKRVVVTGGTGGLGSVVARVFREKGWDVDAPGRRELDVTDDATVRSRLQGVPVDLLVCCAGVALDDLLLRQSERDRDEVLDVNFHGARRCAEAVLPGMIRAGRGHIIFVSSHSAVHPPAGQSAYAAAKAALLGLTVDLAQRHGPSGIRVNAVLPGFLETRMTAGIQGLRFAEVVAAHCLRRFNTPQAVANFIRCLEEEMPHTSGQTFQLDSRSF